MVKVSTSNFYVGNKQPRKDARFLASFDCDASGIQEGHSGNYDAIKEELKDTHRVIIGKERSINTLDVPVVVKRKGIRVIRHWSRQISVRAQKENIGAPRNATVVRFKKDGVRYSFINTHTNAAVQSRKTGEHLPTSIRRVSEYVAGMIVLEAMIHNARRRGDVIILTGDLNYRADRGGVWKFSPQSLFRRTRLRYISHGPDYIACSRSLRFKDIRIVPTRMTGADHAWIVATLT